MLEKDEINRILEAIPSIDVLEIGGKFFKYSDVSEFFGSHGYTKVELEKIEQEGNEFTEDDYEDYLNKEELEFEIAGYSYEAGTSFRAIDSNDFRDAYLEHCNQDLYEIEDSTCRDVYYTEKELKRVTGKAPLFGYNINKRLEDYRMSTKTPALPNQPTELINGGINESN